MIWRSRNRPWWTMEFLWTLEMTLYFGKVSVVFSLLVFSPSSYEKPLFIGNSIVFNLEFSLSIYWELNYEFYLVFYLIRTFHIGLFFWRCHMAFFIWCFHVAWFHSLIVHVIIWRLIWSQIFYHGQLDDCEYIIKFWCLLMCIGNSLILHIYIIIRKHYHTYFEVIHAFHIWFWNNVE